MAKLTSFIDSNIWLYILMTDPKNSEAEEKRKREIAQALVTNATIMISTQVINEVCSVLCRKAKLKESNLQQVIQDFYQLCPVISLSPEIFIQASQLRSNHRFSYWDSVIVASALVANVDILYSEDMQHGYVVNGQVKIINPFQIKK